MRADAKIGLALSGGGIRACIFHLGVCKGLAAHGLLGRVASISSVSGASLCVALIFAASGNRWPSDRYFLTRTLPEIERRIMTHDIQAAALCRLPFMPRYWFNRVGLLARALCREWGICGTLQELPDYPYWEINCTTYETGKNFRIRKDYMGDYMLGYTQRADLPIADMAAASAGFPVLIGAYVLDMTRYIWTVGKHGGKETAPRKQCALWDGGVYDNLGLEALYKIGRGLDAEINFLIVSNASGALGAAEHSVSRPLSGLKRLLDIALDQVSALRTRDILSAIIAKGDGLYIQIGETTQQIARRHGLDETSAARLLPNCLTSEEATRAAHYPTTLRTPSQGDFNLLLQHGYEAAVCSVSCQAL